MIAENTLNALHVMPFEHDNHEIGRRQSMRIPYIDGFLKSYATTIGMRPPMRIPNKVNRNIVNAIGGSQRTGFQHMKS